MTVDKGRCIYLAIFAGPGWNTVIFDFPEELVEAASAANGTMVLMVDWDVDELGRG